MTDSDPEGLQQHPLVDALLPDPSQPPPETRRIVGYLGRSTSSGVWRLYTSPTLNRYVEIPETDILYTQQLPGDRGTAVWVRRGVKLRYVAVQTGQVEADYLSGPIATAAAQAPLAPRGFASPRVVVPPYTTRVCTHVGCNEPDTGYAGECGGGDSFGCETTVWCTQPSECSTGPIDC
jgi:hypothetical protein